MAVSTGVGASPTTVSLLTDSMAEAASGGLHELFDGVVDELFDDFLLMRVFPFRRETWA